MTPADTTRLTHLLAMTASPFDGEALSATRLAWKFMQDLGINFQDVVEGRAIPNARQAREKAYEEGFEKGYAEGLRDGKRAPRPRPGTWQALVRDLLEEHGEQLSEWEEGFLESFRRRGWHTPTDRQRPVFERIANKLGVDLPDDPDDPGPPPW